MWRREICQACWGSFLNDILGDQMKELNVPFPIAAHAPAVLEKKKEKWEREWERDAELKRKEGEAKEMISSPKLGKNPLLFLSFVMNSWQKWRSFWINDVKKEGNRQGKRGVRRELAPQIVVKRWGGRLENQREVGAVFLGMADPPWKEEEIQMGPIRC